MGSDSLQTRSDQAWTEMAWKVAGVQQELEVPSSRTGSRTPEIGSGLAGIPSGLVWGGCGGGRGGMGSGWFLPCGERGRRNFLFREEAGTYHCERTDVD